MVTADVVISAIRDILKLIDCSPLCSISITGEPELYSSHVTDEAPEDALVGKWCEQHGKSTVPERKPGADRNNRTVYGWSGLYDADAGSGKVPECGKSAEEGRKGESLRRDPPAPYAAAGCDADSSKESIPGGICMRAVEMKRVDLWEIYALLEMYGRTYGGGAGGTAGECSSRI